MWREAVLPARQGRGPLHSAVGGVCRTRHSFRGGPPRTAKHSRFGGAGGERPPVDRGLSTGSVERRGSGGGQSGRDRSVDGLSLIHISEPTRLGMISYAVFCLKK